MSPETSVDPETESVRAQLGQLETLEELADWVGTFREHLRLARADQQRSLRTAVDELEARYRARRAELA